MGCMEKENERGESVLQAFMCTFCTCDVIPTKIRGGGGSERGEMTSEHHACHVLMSCSLSHSHHIQS